ncbi:MAG: monofunctional biosynthetic peptidoglycan transglycosylase [Pseudazoarcus pumilus]|nr:monofunctional biosynthetic peptidoglycan transglycosylase [Pseudazoarcus pumilus]
MRRGLRRLALTLGAVLLAFALVQGWFLAHVLWWRSHDPAMTSFMQIRLDELRARDPRARLDHRWVPYERISTHLKRAVVAAEDDAFMDHYGFDWSGIQRAIERNRARGARAAGGSTITQQLAKNLFLSPSRSYVRKAQEAVITVMIEATWSKRRILEVYLNVVEWGDGIFGAEAAARHHYGISADRLGPVEGTQMAVMLPNPRHYADAFGPRLAAIAESVRGRMMYTRIPD